MDEHLTKPFTREDLRRALERWLPPPEEEMAPAEPIGVGSAS